MKDLIIDIGHGGKDNGATALGYREDELNLVIGRRVAYILDADITRDEDIGLPAEARAAQIKNNYRYCISIHLNAASGQGSGIETIHSAFSPVGYELARSIADELSASIGLPVRRVFSRKNAQGQDYYFMHRWTGKTTTVIVEGLFLDNIEDITKLNVENIAQGIARGYIKFAEKTAPPSIAQALYKKISLTEVAVVDPLALTAEIVNKWPSQIQGNYVNGTYFWDGKPVGMLASGGKIISNYPTHTCPVGTLVVQKSGNVFVDYIADLRLVKDLYFAVSGNNLFPIDLKKECFHKDTNPWGKDYTDVARCTWQTCIGYNPSDKKVYITQRPSSDIERCQLTMKNLGCTMAVKLDGGSASSFWFDGHGRKATRQLNNIIRF